MARRRRKPHGIFCLEGDWWGNMKKPSSVEPVLRLLRQWEPHYVPYVRRDVATAGEFTHYLGKWTQKAYDDYPILYLAFHGQEGILLVGDRRLRESVYTLDALEERLADRCHRRIIYFGSCETVDLHGNRLNRFLRRTGALAVCGYREQADWLRATAFDLLVFAAMQDNALTSAGVAAMKKRILREAPLLSRQLGFRMKIRG